MNAADPSTIGWARKPAPGVGGSASAPQPVGVRSAPGAGAAPSYRAGSGLSQELAGFFPGNSSGDSAVLPSQRLSLDRTRSLVRDDPHASAAVTRLVDMLVGQGWLLIATPDARALGIEPAAAREIGRTIRSEWRLYSRDPRKFNDSRRRLSVNGQFRLAARTMATAGEVTACLGWKKRGGRYSTTLALIDPDRICNPNNAPDTQNLRGGVEFDADGVAIAYHVRDGHPADWWNSENAWRWTRIARETSWGRPVFVHAFEGDREDQTRAITPFAALISRLRMISRFSDTELASATANALFAAFITTDLPASDIAERLAQGRPVAAGGVMGLEQTIEYFEKNPTYLGGVRVPVLPPGSDFKMNNAPRQTTSFPAFQTAFLQSIASSVGIAYEQLSMDFSNTNYSSVRAALNEVWRVMKRLQAVFAEQFVQPFYMAFLEEAFDKGLVVAPKGAPDFWAMPEAWSAARWIGPGRGYVDAVKEAEAAALRIEGLTSNLQLENAEQGLDLEENLDQIQLENEELAARGLSRMSLAKAAATNKIAPDSDEVESASAPTKGA